MAREQRQLAAIIREHAAGRRVEPPDKLLMRAQVGKAAAQLPTGLYPADFSWHLPVWHCGAESGLAAAMVHRRRARNVMNANRSIPK